MRKLIALVVSTAALLVASPGNAATVDLFLTQRTATTWDLTANVAPAGGLNLAGIAVQITSGGTGSFVIAQTNQVIDPFIINGGFSFQSNLPGVSRYSFGPGIQGFITGPTTGFLVGTFTSIGAATLLECNQLDCPTALSDDFETELDYSLTTVPFPAPEPGAMVLLGIGLGAISLLRRKSA